MPSTWSFPRSLASPLSGPTHEKGWNRSRVARAWVELMQRLGYSRYGAHGTDVGALITPEVGRCAPEQVIGVHVNQLFSQPSGDPAELEGLSEEDRKKVHWLQWFSATRGGYRALQSSAPQTLAHALADSPIGLLAWYYQLAGPQVSADYLLTNVTLHWVMNTAASAARFYYENAHVSNGPTRPTTVPLGLANFADDTPAIRPFAERDHQNIVSWHVYDRGGHHATQLTPDLLTQDIRQFFRLLRANEVERAPTRQARIDRIAE